MGALVTAIMKGNNWGWDAPATLATAAAAIGPVGHFHPGRAPSRVPNHQIRALPQPEFSRLRRGRPDARRIHRRSATSWRHSICSPFATKSPISPGLMLLPISTLVVIVPPLIGKLVDRKGPMPFSAAGTGVPRARRAGADLFRAVEPALDRADRFGAVRTRLGAAAGDFGAWPRPRPFRPPSRA